MSAALSNRDPAARGRGSMQSHEGVLPFRRDNRDVGAPACLVWSVAAIPPMVFAAGGGRDSHPCRHMRRRRSANAPLSLVMSAISLLSVTAGWSAGSALRLVRTDRGAIKLSAALRLGLCQRSGGASRHFGVRIRGAGLSRRSGFGPSMRRPC